MRFTVDAHAIGRHLTGNEVYIRNLLSGFAALDQSSEFIACLSSDNFAANSDLVPERFTRRAVSGNSLLRLGFDLTRQVLRDKSDLLHVQYTAPLYCPVPTVVSVHDVSFLEHPEYFRWQRARQLQITVKRTLERAACVIAPSDFSRSRILQAYDLRPETVISVPIAASSMFRPISRDVASKRVLQRFAISEPFVVTVGDLQPRKNQLALIEAFEILTEQHASLPHKLVIVGKDTWFSERVHHRAKHSKAASRIQFTGWVSDEDLVWLYNAADCLAFPSHYEGFGLPLLEAMACGRAVTCSETSAIAEVADSAALLFDPKRPESLAQCLRDLLLNPELRSRMERLGLQRASLFSWERTARLTLDAYYQVAGAAKSTGSASVVRR